MPAAASREQTLASLNDSHYHFPKLFRSTPRSGFITVKQLRIFLLHLAALALFSEAVAANATRTYYIAAEEVLWDYAPSYPVNPMHGAEFNEEEKVFVEGNNTDRIGRQY